MADYIVTSGELTSVANAIREKNGTSSSLSWPNGFVSGIGSGGGGSSDFSTANVTINATIENSGGGLKVYSVELINIGFNPFLSKNTMKHVIVLSNGLNTAEVVLYQGEQILVDPSNNTNKLYITSVSGNIEEELDMGEPTGSYFIKGDCTINVTNVEPEEP